jgi:hypothetical protein
MPEVDLRDAIAMLKAGNRAGAEGVLRQIHGMPADPAATAIAKPMPQRDAVTPGSLLRKQIGPQRPGMMNQGMRPGMRPFAKGGDVGGGRSAGRGGPTVEELQDYEEEGIFTERKQKRGDYGKTKEAPTDLMPKKPHAFKKLAKGGSVSSASSRADGCAMRGKTKGKMV